MQALAAHLKRRNLKMIEEELSLPKIPEVNTNQFTKTSVRIKKMKPVIKYVSETTFSPEEQHVHDQLRLMLQKREASPMGEHSRIVQLLKGREPIFQKKVLPKIRDSRASAKRVDSKEGYDPKASRKLSSRRKSKSVNTKINLDSIFTDQNEFIKSYFADINDHLRR